jgi:hypothetical protein
VVAGTRQWLQWIHCRGVMVRSYAMLADNDNRKVQGSRAFGRCDPQRGVRKEAVFR